MVPGPQNIPTDPTLLLWIFFVIGIIFAAGFAFGLLYHWIRYGYMYPLVWIMMPVYIVGSIVLIGAMLAGIGAV